MSRKTKLLSAVKKGKKALVEKLLKKNIGIDKHYIIGHAIQGGNIEILKLLLENPEIYSSRFDVSVAGKSGNINIVKLLIDHLTTKYSPYDLYARAFIGAAEGGHMHALRYLLKMEPAFYNDADVVRKAYTGAADMGHVHVLAFLKKSRFNRSAVDYERALNGSASRGHLDVVKRVAPKVKCWDLALLEASYSYKYKQGHLPVIQYLVRHAKHKLSKEAIVKACNITKNRKIKKLLRANALVKGVSLKIKMKTYRCVIQLVYVPLSDQRHRPNPSTSEIYKYFSEKGRLGEFVKDIVGYDPTYKNIRGVAMDKSLNIEFTVDVDALSWRQASTPTNEKEVAADIAFANQSFADGCYEGSSDNECHYPDARDKERAVGEFAYKVLDVKHINK